jgi:hypothetical protein
MDNAERAWIRADERRLIADLIRNATDESFIQEIVDGLRENETAELDSDDWALIANLHAKWFFALALEIEVTHSKSAILAAATAERERLLTVIRARATKYAELAAEQLLDGAEQSPAYWKGLAFQLFEIADELEKDGQ